jgi:hypothetical protein
VTTHRMRVCATVLFAALAGLVYAQGAEPSVYTVQKGDTLSDIAGAELADTTLWPLIAQYNRLGDASALREGQRLLIPTVAALVAADIAESESEDAAGLLVEIRALRDELAALRTGLAASGIGLTPVRMSMFEASAVGDTPSDWEYPSGGSWGVADRGTRVLQQSDRSIDNRGAVTGDAAWRDYIAQTDIRIEHSGDAGVFAYWGGHERNYRLRTDDRMRRIQIAKRTPRDGGGHHTHVLAARSIDIKENRWYTYKLQAANLDGATYLRGKVWPRGSREPAHWAIQAADHGADRYTRGKAGLWTKPFAPSYRGTQFDNFSVLTMP